MANTEKITVIEAQFPGDSQEERDVNKEGVIEAIDLAGLRYVVRGPLQSIQVEAGPEQLKGTRTLLRDTLGCNITAERPLEEVQAEESAVGNDEKI